MLRTRLTALTLAGLLATASGMAFAGSTGPTDPIDSNGPRTGSSSAGQNVDGSTPSPRTSTPGTKGMDNDGSNGSTRQGGGMSNGQGMGGSSGSSGSSGSAGGSSGSSGTK
ncbi:hypothetical protein ACIPL1_17610 [Pseudomonas sp. NPDC090202]|uniref:hypothetical protein n=1 Tax=unclassified Pseudomonas TaxID=196821 RepID=UPI0037F8B939